MKKRKQNKKEKKLREGRRVRKEKRVKEKKYMNKEKGEETKRKENFYAKRVRSRVLFYTNKPMFVLVYKETLLNINDPGSSLP